MAKDMLERILKDMLGKMCKDMLENIICEIENN